MTKTRASLFLTRCCGRKPLVHVPAPSQARRLIIIIIIIAIITTALSSSTQQFDFYTYAQLNSVLKQVFFASSDPTAQALSYWGEL